MIKSSRDKQEDFTLRGSQAGGFRSCNSASRGPEYTMLTLFVVWRGWHRALAVVDSWRFAVADTAVDRCSLYTAVVQPCTAYSRVYQDKGLYIGRQESNKP